MKKSLIYLYILFVFSLFSCGNAKDMSGVALYDEETELAFGKQIISYINSVTPPDGIVVIYITERYIDSANIAKRADQWFDYYSKKINNFEDNGVAFIISVEPKLIQVRVGSNYSYYLKMKGITSGHDYIKMQEDISTNGIETMIPVFTDHTLNAIKSYEDSSWFTKLKVRLGVSWVGELLYDMASPSESIFGKIITSVVHFIAIFMGIGGSWFFSLLLVILLVFLLNKGIDHFFTDGDDKLKPGNISLTNYTRFLTKKFGLKMAVDLLVGLPSLAAITILSNARTEDAIMLRQANIPHLELMDWANSCYSQAPSVTLLLMLAVVIYLSYITVPGRVLSLAGLRGHIQRHLYHSNMKLQKECWDLYKGRKAELNILAGVIIFAVLLPLFILLFKFSRWLVSIILSGLCYIAVGLRDAIGEFFTGSDVPKVDINDMDDLPNTETGNGPRLKMGHISDQEINDADTEKETVTIDYKTMDAANTKFGTTGSLVAGVIYASMVENKPSDDYTMTPASALLKKISRGGLIFTTCLTIIIGEIFTKPIVIYLTIFLALQTLWNLYKEFSFHRYINKIYRLYKTDLSYLWFIKSEIGYLVGCFCIIALLLYYGSGANTSASLIENPIAIENSQQVNSSFLSLEGTYYVREKKGEKTNGLTAVLKSDNQKDYTMTVYSDAPTEIFYFTYDTGTGEITSEELGNGNVTIKKSINQIKIKFEKGWTIVR